jgi:methylmalonyl-CoA mutase C-terminal domain/subunit
LVIAGGIIPDDDIPILKQMGVKAAFGPGTPTHDIVAFIKQEAGAD